MKRIFSIALLVLLTFNMGGYYFLFWILKAQADTQLTQQLDENFKSVDGEFEIKIPLTLPYPLQQTDFERKEGGFVYKNEYYRLVKQKLDDDTLTIVCVKNHKAKQLAEVMDEFSTKTSGDQNEGLMLTGKVLLEYEFSDLLSVISVDGWIQNIDRSIFSHSNYSASLASPSPPPKI